MGKHGLSRVRTWKGEDIAVNDVVEYRYNPTAEPSRGIVMGFPAVNLATVKFGDTALLTVYTDYLHVVEKHAGREGEDEPDDEDDEEQSYEYTEGDYRADQARIRHYNEKYGEDP